MATPPQGVEPDTDAIRLMMIGYPNTATFDGGFLAFFASIPPTLSQRHNQQMMDWYSGEFRLGPEITGTM